jgi:hypothetical protein
MKDAPEVKNAIVDRVLAYRPKPKTKAQKKRNRKKTALEKETKPTWRWVFYLEMKTVKESTVSVFSDQQPLKGSRPFSVPPQVLGPVVASMRTELPGTLPFRVPLASEHIELAEVRRFLPQEVCSIQ